MALWRVTRDGAGNCASPYFQEMFQTVKLSDDNVSQCIPQNFLNKPSRQSRKWAFAHYAIMGTLRGCHTPPVPNTGISITLASYTYDVLLLYSRRDSGVDPCFLWTGPLKFKSITALGCLFGSFLHLKRHLTIEHNSLAWSLWCRKLIYGAKYIIIRSPIAISWPIFYTVPQKTLYMRRKLLILA